jgi:superkiller protein 3
VDWFDWFVRELSHASFATDSLKMNHDYDNAIDDFHVVLRRDPEDELTLLRLGEAQLLAGRHIAALKALERARDLAPHLWVSLYLIGRGKAQLGEHAEAVSCLKGVLKIKPSEFGVLVSLAQSQLDLARDEARHGLFARSVLSFSDAISTALLSTEQNQSFRGIAWKIIGDALLSLPNSHPYAAPLSGLLEQLSVMLQGPSSIIIEFLDIPAAEVPSLKISKLALLVYDYRLALVSSESGALGSAWFDLGVALRSWASRIAEKRLIDLAKQRVVDCFMEATKREPGNDMFWMALGNATFLVNGGLAQHAYFRALQVQPKVSL